MFLPRVSNVFMLAFVCFVLAASVEEEEEEKEKEEEDGKEKETISVMQEEENDEETPPTSEETPPTNEETPPTSKEETPPTSEEETPLNSEEEDQEDSENKDDSEDKFVYKNNHCFYEKNWKLDLDESLLRKVDDFSKCRDECFNEPRCIWLFEYPGETGCKINIKDVEDYEIDKNPPAGYKMHIFMKCISKFGKV